MAEDIGILVKKNREKDQNIETSMKTRASSLPNLQYKADATRDKLSKLKISDMDKVKVVSHGRARSRQIVLDSAQSHRSITSVQSVKD